MLIYSLSKTLFLLFLINLLSIESSISQERVLHDNNNKIRFNYKNNQLIEFTCFDLKKTFYKRYRDKETYFLTWGNGEVEIKNKNNQCNGSATYTYKFDTLYRVYESSIFSIWSNHIYEEYMARKYYSTDSLPSKCYHYSFLNYPKEEIVSWNCEINFIWLNIVEKELKTRNVNYEKGCKDNFYDNWPFERKADDFTKFWSTDI